ncbi:MAG TPA: SHOCT domain-containing protein [bacterium]|nr:SHOCT domain-containing protein [bacterium]
MWPYGYGPGWGPMIFGWVWMLVFVAAIVAVIVLITRAPGTRYTDTALEVLRRRYAAGELTKEQFEQMKREVAA